ncbi:TonB-dependent receptor [Balneolales bacterium ANBcel1]|nr:TonB-dependent receptor [Balneolales bacterium ANBcel1]
MFFSPYVTRAATSLSAGADPAHQKPASTIDPPEPASSFGESALSAETGHIERPRLSDRDQPYLVISPDSIIAVDLDEVVISAQRVPVRYSEMRRSVRVMDRRQISDAPVHDLAGLLSGVRSVDIRHRGTYGMQSDVSIRGGTFDQTLVLLNGVNVTDPQTGHHNLNVPVDLQSIERVEILHGPGARIFGPNAFNGAINIITKEPGASQIHASLSGGQHRFGSAGISGGAQTGPVNHHLSIHGMTSDGFTENTDFRTGNLFYRSQLGFNSGRLDLQAGYNEKAFGANSFYTPRFPDQFEHTRSVFASLRWLPEGSVRLAPAVYWRRHHDRFELFRHESPDWYGGHNYHQTDILGASLNWVYSSRFGASSVGLDYRYEHIYSNVLGEPMSAPRRVSGYDDAWFTHAYHRSGLSLMLEQSYATGPFSFSAGTLIYSNSDLDVPVTLFPGADLGLRLHEHLRWYLSANRTLRLPTFTDLFYSGPDNLGNPDLEPEEAITVETGLKSSWNGVETDAAVFHRRGTNMIDWIRRPDDKLWRSENLTSVNITGFEAGIRIPLGSRRTAAAIARRSQTSGAGSQNASTAPRNQYLANASGDSSPPETTTSHSPSAVYSVHSYLSLQYTYMHADKQSGEFISNYVLDHLTHKVDISLLLPVARNGGVLSTVTWQDRAGEYLHYEEGEFTGTRPFDSFWTVDLNLFYRIGEARLFMEASNVLDTSYMDIPNVPQPGRWMRAGIEMSL